MKHEPTQDAVCDFVDGIAFGEALGVAMRSVSGWWEAVDVVSTGKSKVSVRTGLNGDYCSPATRT